MTRRIEAVPLVQATGRLARWEPSLLALVYIPFTFLLAVAGGT